MPRWESLREKAATNRQEAIDKLREEIIDQVRKSRAAIEGSFRDIMDEVHIFHSKKSELLEESQGTMKYTTALQEIQDASNQFVQPYTHMGTSLRLSMLQVDHTISGTISPEKSTMASKIPISEEQQDHRTGQNTEEEEDVVNELEIPIGATNIEDTVTISSAALPNFQGKRHRDENSTPGHRSRKKARASESVLQLSPKVSVAVIDSLLAIKFSKYSTANR
jgi:hypothetical protein